MELETVFEDNEIIVINKPQGIPCQDDKTGDESIYSIIVKKYGYAGLINRLDRPVGGLVVFCKNQNATAALSKQMQEKTFDKKYLAVVCGDAPTSMQLTDYLLKNERLNISKIVHKNTKNAKEAVLDFKLISKVKTEDYGILSLLEVRLLTGRHHQIRAQLSGAGMPLYGDTKYNSMLLGKRGFFNIGLFSYSIAFFHPKTKHRLEVKGGVPKYFPFDLFQSDCFLEKAQP